ncbi:MAG TPA: hypothetical protein DG753_12725 [Clostridium sp.]|nr:hypothetical protein [Clostridium sp.]
MIYYTSDLHLCHINLLKQSNRPFLDIENMNETIKDNWNKKINDNDIVYILGDIGFPRKK